MANVQQIIYDHVLPAAYALLPPEMNDAKATAMLIAIGIQESRFRHRRQLGGPARGFWQFELMGVRGVLEHPATAHHAREAAYGLGYKDFSVEDPLPWYDALEHNDVLAAVLARLTLWQHRDTLPAPDELEIAWHQYLDCWKPGRPRPDHWNEFYTDAWALVHGARPSLWGPDPIRRA